MTIETWLEKHPGHEIGCDIITLNPGKFGPHGHRVRLLVIDDGVLVEAGGEIRYILASEAD